MNVDLDSIPAVNDKVLTASTRLDKLAIVLSSVCLLHCLLAPLIFTLLPIIALNTLWEDLLFHKLMLWLVLPTSTVALLIGCRKHQDFKILGTGIMGMMMLLLIALVGHDLLSAWQEKLATSIAGITLAFSHLLNYRACQSQPCPDNNCTSKHHH
jgi:hypothetical protein